MTYSEQEHTMNYALLFAGIVSLVIGVLLLTQTTATLALIMLLVGLSWFIQGVFNLMSIFMDKSQWGWKLFGGVIGVAAGLLVLRNPIESTAVVPAAVALIMGVFGLLIGLSGLIEALQGGGWGVGVFGVVAILVGLLFMFNSFVSGQILVWILALLLVVQGALGIYYAYKYR
ncbi:MAG: hypothetical protein GXP42_04025 [Chloroflexi bacterium]|nr:hypothetical protein [Chloroflexota bacterium]